MTFKMPTVEEFTQQLKSMGVGKETRVICYDNNDGTMAARGAFLLTVFGVKVVSILNGKFSTWCPPSAEEYKAVDKASGASFEFVQDTNMTSTAAEIKEIAEGKSQVQLVDVRGEVAFKKSSIPNSKHMPYTSVMSNHALKETREIIEAFKNAGIDTNKQMIFIGGAGAAAVKAAADHIGLPGQCKLFDVNVPDWIT